MATVDYKPLAEQVMPLYVVDERGNPALLGSSVPIQVSDQHFLVTAAHVLDQNDASLSGPNASSLYLPIEGTLTELPRVPAFKTSLPASGRREDDPVDLAVISIPTAMASRFDPWRFVKPRDFAVNDHTSPAGQYVFTGCPASKNRPTYGTNTFRPFCLVYTSRSVPAADINDPEIKQHVHVGVRFDRQRVRDSAGNLLTAPNPSGMSGGPVWVLPCSTGEPFRLVAIGIEHRASSHFLIGTRISAVVSGIVSEFPHLRACLPEVEGLRINMRREEQSKA